MALRQVGGHQSSGLRRTLLGLTSASLLLTATSSPVSAQMMASGVPPPGAVSGPLSAAYSAEELEAMLAPIALCPDMLLSQLLMAAAYPDQVAAAARWMQLPGNQSLQGEALDNTLRPFPWDPAVKSLVPFPQVLNMLAAHPDWTAQLAFAVAEQENATFDAVQRLRRKAWLAGQLRSNAQQSVRMDGDLIVIEPAQPSVVYVPVYNPEIVYGVWPYPVYPPYYFPPSYYVPADVLAAGIFFGAGILVAGSLWGWSRPVWRDRRFHIDRHRYEYFRHFHRPPPGDWRDWRDDRWRSPPRPPDGGRFRPAPTRPGDGPVRPAPVRPPEDGRFRPAPISPGDGTVRPAPMRPDATPFRPMPLRPDTEQFRPAPPRSGGGGFAAPPSHREERRHEPPSFGGRGR